MSGDEPFNDPLTGCQSEEEEIDISIFLSGGEPPPSPSTHQGDARRRSHFLFKDKHGFEGVTDNIEEHFRLAQHQAVLEKEKQEVWGDVLSSAKAVSQLLVSVDEVRKRRGMDRHPSSQYHEDFHSPCLNRRELFLSEDRSLPRSSRSSPEKHISRSVSDDPRGDRKSFDRTKESRSPFSRRFKEKAEKSTIGKEPLIPLPNAIYHMGGGHRISAEDLKWMVRRGIPADRRRVVWRLLTGVDYTIQQMPGVYESLLANNSDVITASTQQIEKDLRRTFPGHSMVDSRDGIDQLRRILTAYSWRNSEVGYCQSMNFVCAFLILVLAEEEAFWVLVHLVENVLPSGFYSKDMISSTVELLCFESIIADRFPAIAKHFKKFGTPLQLVAAQWFLCLFVNITPAETTFRIWDCVLLEGYEVVVRVALGLISLFQSEILSCETESEMFVVLRDLPHRVNDAEELFMNHAFKTKCKVPTARLFKLRRSHTPQVMATAQERQRRRAEMQRQREMSKNADRSPSPSRLCRVMSHSSLRTARTDHDRTAHRNRSIVYENEARSRRSTIVDCLDPSIESSRSLFPPTPAHSPTPLTEEIPCRLTSEEIDWMAVLPSYPPPPPPRFVNIPQPHPQKPSSAKSTDENSPPNEGRCMRESI